MSLLTKPVCDANTGKVRNVVRPIVYVIFLCFVVAVLYGLSEVVVKQQASNNSLCVDMGKIEGNYTLREKNGDVSVNGIQTALIKKERDSLFHILVINDFDPEVFYFVMHSDGKLESNQLGTGHISYYEKLDKVTLSFKQGEKTCEFTK